MPSIHKFESSPIVRTRVLRAFDDLVSDGRLELLISRLHIEADTVKVFEDVGSPWLRSRHYRDLRRDWFDASTAWWRDVPGCEHGSEVLRRGVLRVLATAQRHGWPPLVSYWMRVPGRIQVVTHLSKQQLTAFFVSPDPALYEESLC